MPTKEKAVISEINQNAKRLQKLRDKKSILEKEEKELKAFFEGFNQPEIKTGLFVVLIAPQRRETVSLETLKPVFGDELNPYINVALFNKVTVKAKC